MRIFLVSGFFLACSMAFSQKTPLQKLDSMGLKLPATTTPMANYVKFVRTGNFIFTSGNGPTKMDGQLISGTLGADLTIEQGMKPRN